MAGLLGCVVGLLLAPRDALVAWLVAWLGWGSIPIGSLARADAGALIPGSWRELYVRPLTHRDDADAAGRHRDDPAADRGRAHLSVDRSRGRAAALPALRRAWLSTGFFVIRTIVYLIVLSLFAWGLLAAQGELRAPIAAAGVILYALIGSLIGIDFAESTEPEFHSSIYGLLALTNQWLAGISFAILLGLWSSSGKAPRAAAGVLVTAILMWALHARDAVYRDLGRRHSEGSDLVP